MKSKKRNKKKKIKNYQKNKIKRYFINISYLLNKKWKENYQFHWNQRKTKI